MSLLRELTLASFYTQHGTFSNSSNTTHGEVKLYLDLLHDNQHLMQVFHIRAELFAPVARLTPRRTRSRHHVQRAHHRDWTYREVTAWICSFK